MRQKAKRDSFALNGQRRSLISLAGAQLYNPSILGRVRKMLSFRSA